MLIPAVLAIDFGGILRWSQFASAIVILFAGGLALVGLFETTAYSSLSQHKLLLPLGVLFLFLCFQSTAIAPTLVSIGSGGSYTAYTQWLDGLMSTNGQLSSFPISISPSDTAHAAAFLGVLMVLTFASSLVFHSRARLVLLLSAIALAGFSVAVVGVIRKLNPDADWWFIQAKSTAFGGFVNRNNAALMLNLGLAASLGLLSWRMMVLHSIEMDDPDFEFNDLIALVSDRDSFIGILSASGCTAGLLVNGSRGGLVAALVGFLFAFGYVRPRRGKISIPVLAVVVAISVAVLTVPLKLNLESLSRLKFFSETADTLQSDGRLLHWQDGLAAAWAYAPLGSGASTYRFAYLPYQSASPGSWFEHADNLWLEILVETGFIGLACILAIVVLVMVSLRRLGESVDPLDQGIRVAAWFAVGAILISQFFDFGLLLPANLIAALMLATAVISRDIANGGPAVWRQIDAGDREVVRYRGLQVDPGLDDEWAEPPLDNPATVSGAGSSDGPAPAADAPTDRGGFLKKPVPWYQQRPRWWRSVRRVGGFAIAALVLVVGLTALPRLRNNAEIESFTRRVTSEYNQLSYQPDVLTNIRDDLEQLLTTQPDPVAQTQLSEIHRDLGRLAETMEWQPATLTEAARIHRGTNLDRRELPYPPSTATKPRGQLDSQRHYDDARLVAIRTLQTCPLNQLSRAMLVQLQPVLAETPEAEKSLEHLVAFYASEPNRLLRLGSLALENGQITQAKAAYRRALELSPRLTARVMPVIFQNESLSLLDIIPENSSAMQTAATQVLKSNTRDDAFLVKAIGLIDCGNSELLDKKAACHELKARLYQQLEQTDQAIKSFQAAIRLDPTEPRYRLELIQLLFIDQNRPEALQQARMGRELLPDEEAFQAWIDKIAELDRQLVPVDSDEKQPDASFLLDVNGVFN